MSLISLVGLFTLSIRLRLLKKLLSFLVSFAAGSLLGTVFIHLLPEIGETQGFNLNTSLNILFGLLVFFLLEKVICWRHCHIPTSKRHQHNLGMMNLLGDAFHNFTDGIVIAAAYMVNPPLGIATTMAVAFHEIPQEIGDFSVLLYAGFSRKKALFFNFLSALTALLGAVFTLIFAGQNRVLLNLLLPFTAGGFIYIASADLIPELKKDLGLKKNFLQILGLGLGIFIIFVIKHN